MAWVSNLKHNGESFHIKTESSTRVRGKAKAPGEQESQRHHTMQSPPRWQPSSHLRLPRTGTGGAWRGAGCELWRDDSDWRWATGTSCPNTPWHRCSCLKLKRHKTINTETKHTALHLQQWQTVSPLDEYIFFRSLFKVGSHYVTLAGLKIPEIHLRLRDAQTYLAPDKWILELPLSLLKRLCCQAHCQRPVNLSRSGG
jgi:hypothetical protein